MSDDEAELTRLAEKVADCGPVDWEAEGAEHPREREVIEQLRVVACVAEAHSSLDATSGEEDDTRPISRALESWGALRVLERIGRGGFGEIYRAFDPVLQREVALKLWRDDRTTSGLKRQHYLGEARRLARVRHPNVVTVFGADEHDGRLGLWMELLRGRTLEECCEEQGPFGASEACAAGASICRGLAAVHAAGLVHRDVKTANVIREVGGRIVLLDLGAAREITPGSSEGELSGTLLSMPPEQARGEEVGPSADLYALGVLLYRLVSGRYPVEASRLSELIAKHERGERTPLADVRPDLPPAFTQLVMRAISTDPSARFASAGEMEQALLDVLGTVRSGPDAPLEGRSSRARTGWSIAAAAVVVASATVAIALFARDRAPVPSARPGPSAASEDSTSHAPIPLPGVAATPVSGRQSTSGAAAIRAIDASVVLFRHSAAGDRRLAPGARVHPGDSLYMTVRGVRPMHLYVLDQDDHGGLFVLFPVKGLDVRNPIAAQTPLRIPGTRRGSTVDWQVSDAGGEETIVVVASPVPLLELEHAIAALPGGDAAASASDHGDGTRGIGSMVVEPPSAPGAAATRITHLLASLADARDSAASARLWRITLENPGR